MMVFIKKIMVPWEIKYGSIFLGGKDYVKNKRILDDYFGTTFELETFKRTYPNRHFYHNPSNNFIRLSCKQFFTQLKDGSILYLQPINKNRKERSKNNLCSCILETLFSLISKRSN